MNQSRAKHSTTVIENFLYVFGGITAREKVRLSIE